MESKMYGIHKENKRFLVSLGARDSAFSQKYDLKRASEWEATSIDFIRKGKERFPVFLGARDSAFSQK